jgi:hypothetical protein
VHDLVERVVAAVADGDPVAIKLLLHPYLHWTEPGVKLKGRTNVLAHLQALGTLARPDECELRDGQIYRWTRGLSGGGTAAR